MNKRFKINEFKLPYLTIILHFTMFKLISNWWRYARLNVTIKIPVFFCPTLYDVLDHAISDAIQARDEVITRNKENRHQHHVLHFRSKKNDCQTITICAREPLHFYVRLLHNNAIL